MVWLQAFFFWVFTFGKMIQSDRQIFAGNLEPLDFLRCQDQRESQGLMCIPSWLVAELVGAYIFFHGQKWGLFRIKRDFLLGFQQKSVEVLINEHLMLMLGMGRLCEDRTWMGSSSNLLLKSCRCLEHRCVALVLDVSWVLFALRT